MPRVVESWLRNYLACMAMYLAVGGLWAYYIYWCFGSVFFGPGKMPGAADVLEQIKARAPCRLFWQSSAFCPCQCWTPAARTLLSMQQHRHDKVRTGQPLPLQDGQCVHADLVHSLPSTAASALHRA
jgi:hypothetical protein